MSRGGRGGGRGGKAPGGLDFPWEHDPDIDQYLNYTPTELFPVRLSRSEVATQANFLPLLQNVETTITAPPTAAERRSFYHANRLREMRRAGPFYATGDLSKRPSRNAVMTGRVGKAQVGNDSSNPFTSMETYSSKYNKKTRVLPDLKSYPFIKEFFPRELWDVMGIADEESEKKAKADGVDPPKKKRKLLQIAKANTISRLEALEAEEARRAEAGEDEEEDEEKEDGEGQPLETQDDDYEDGESEADDYNAEAYFDNGEDDYGDEDAGDDGGYYE